MRSRFLVVTDDYARGARFDLIGGLCEPMEAQGLRLVAIVWGDAAPALGPLADRAAILRFSDEPVEPERVRAHRLRGEHLREVYKDPAISRACAGRITAEVRKLAAAILGVAAEDIRAGDQVELDPATGQIRRARRGGDFPEEGRRDPRQIDHEDGTVSYRERGYSG